MNLQLRPNFLVKVILVLTVFVIAIYHWHHLHNPETYFRNGDALNLAQDDESLLTFIRQNHLFPHSTFPYNLSSPLGDPTGKEFKEWELVYKLLGNKVTP